MPPPKIIKSVELPHDPDKAREVIADLKQLAAQHKEVCYAFIQTQ